VLVVLAEDDYGETKARLEAICEHLGVKLEDLPIRIWCLPGHDITLATVSDRGEVQRAPFIEALEDELSRMRDALVVLDSLADVAVYEEKLRQPVNALFKRVLGRLCKDFGATVLVLAHPSKAAMEDGSHYSGSTAHNNAVRSRLVLEAPHKKSSRRTLSVGKNNYGPNSAIELFLMGPVFHTRDDAGQVARRETERAVVMEVVLDLLGKGVRVVRGAGSASGQKPKDIAVEVRDRGIDVDAKRVLEILNQAERDGVLSYQTAWGKRPASFVRAK
jgi:RecA-family ATPase